jgi:GNAT superfamily N-acetyltransferase
MDRSRTLKNLNRQILPGTEVSAYFNQLAELRIEIFKDYPYLYEGSLEYEKKYLARYLKNSQAVLVLIWDQNKLVGAASGVPLKDEEDFVQEAFLSQKRDIHPFFYFGESLLKVPYRGQGLGHVFFDEREKWAKALGFKKTCFCSVIRPEDHPLRPTQYHPLNAFWLKRGYAPDPELVGSFSWQDKDQKFETKKPMQFWVKGI